MLAHLAERKGVITQVSHQRAPALLNTLRDKVLEHGPIVHAVCEFYKRGPSPMTGARPHDGRLRARHRHRALDVRAAGAPRAGRRRRDRQPGKRIGTPDVN